MNHWPFVCGKKITGLQVLELIEWVNKSWPANTDLREIDGKPIFALPPLQRDAVWRPKQVVDLWDSLMRGLPIGILYLIWQPSGIERDLVIKSGKTIRTKLSGYDLLDGQQRIRALLLGAIGVSEEKRCLWVDLGNSEGTPYPVLRITSKGQPFGYDPKTGNKFSLDQRRTARKRLDENGKVQCKDAAGMLREAFDRELFESEVFQGGNRIHQPPVPYGASEHTFKLPGLLSAWQKAAPRCADEGVAALRMVAGNGPSQEALIRLHQAFEKIKNAEVALLCVDPESFLDSKDDLLKLFDRIGAGGTPLSVEERLYSIYKYHWPNIRDAVNEIHRRAGRVLSPTKIASTAIRIAYAEAYPDRNDTPDVATFSKVVVDQKEKGFQDNLNKLIPPRSQEANENGTLLHSFETIKSLLWHGEDVGHFWIPEVLLVSLPAELWQVLAFWAWRHPNRENPMLSRQEAVRFALFWHLTVRNNEKAARWAFDYIKKNKETADFPGAALYKQFTGNGEDRCAHKLIPPEEFTRRLCKEENACWRTDDDRFVENGIRNELGSHWWWDGKKMLPWLQKDYIRRVFPDYVPLTDHEDDVPYDVDHICPSKDWRDDWRSLEKRLLDVGEDLKKRVCDCRDAVGGGIGNLQLLDSSVNRECQADDIADKMKFISHKDQPPTVEDVRAMADFAFAPEHRELWGRVSREGKVGDRRWNEDRLKAFQRAVELRAAWLYRRFHDDLGFEAWTKVQGEMH